MNNMTVHERIVQALFKERYGIQLSKITTAQPSKSSDFEFSRASERVVCELKTLTEVVPSIATGWEVTEHSSGLVEATRDDNAANRIGSKIHEAAQQLSRYDHPRLLILLNEEPFADPLDFKQVFTGRDVLCETPIGRFVNIATRRISEGIIKEEKYDIDLYVWIEREEDDKFYFFSTSPSGVEIVRDVFRDGGSDGR